MKISINNYAKERTMAQIIETKEIPMKDLVIGKGQVRVRNVGADIEELVASIKKMGLLEPIVVSPSEQDGKYEILTGQRRYLAHKQLKKDKILACILDEKVDETTAKIISITENLVRKDPNSKDYIDACTALYKRYGTIKAVAEETGLPYHKVSQYVKYDRLQPELKKMVDAGEVDIKVALRAQDAASVTGDFKVDDAITLAKELSTMSGAQQTRVMQQKEDNPTAGIDEIIEAAKTGEKITQIVVTVTSTVHKSLKQYAKDESTNIDDAAASLITEGLISKGYAQEE